jgi:hypothetical protein
MFGDSPPPFSYKSSAYETAANQAWLEYYDSYERRRKYFNNSRADYWESSSYYNAALSFCFVSNQGLNGSIIANNIMIGVVPAFCVR